MGVQHQLHIELTGHFSLDRNRSLVVFEAEAFMARVKQAVGEEAGRVDSKGAAVVTADSKKKDWTLS